MIDIKRILVKQHLQKLIENGTPFKFGKVEFYRLTLPDEKIDSIHYQFLYTSNYDNDCNILKEDAALIGSGYPGTFDIEALLESIELNELYFTRPLHLLAVNICKSEYKNDYLKQSPERFAKIMKHLN